MELARAAGCGVMALDLASFEVIRAFRKVRVWSVGGRGGGEGGARALGWRAEGLVTWKLGGAQQAGRGACSSFRPNSRAHSTHPPTHSSLPHPNRLLQTITDLLEGGSVDVCFCNEVRRGLASTPQSSGAQNAEQM